MIVSPIRSVTMARVVIVSSIGSVKKVMGGSVTRFKDVALSFIVATTWV